MHSLFAYIKSYLLLVVATTTTTVVVIMAAIILVLFMDKFIEDDACVTL